MGRVLLLVEPLSGGFGQFKREDRWARARRTPLIYSAMAFHNGGLGRLKNPSIQELLPPAL
jgi:hypothetical protein